MSKSIPTVLHVEDECNDRLLMKIAFKKAGARVDMRGVEDGEEALDYLQGLGAYANRGQYPFPKLVLLDLKLPRKSGLEILAWIRSRPELKNLPVVILSSSEQTVDQQRASELGASHYFVKPVSVQPLRKIAAEINSQRLAH